MGTRVWLVWRPDLWLRRRRGVCVTATKVDWDGVSRVSSETPCLFCSVSYNQGYGYCIVGAHWRGSCLLHGWGGALDFWTHTHQCLFLRLGLSLALAGVIGFDIK